MKQRYNSTRPLVMHIDLNSCFATVEQQARPMLRGRPVAIVNRRTEHTMIVTASYEAKAMGVKLGMRLRDARKLCPSLVGIESDPAKYRYVYHKLMAIMSEYSSHVRMKSIDEGVIDFALTTGVMQQRDLVDIGHEIKRRLRNEIGCAMRCNVGIGTNRFLAKMAASLHKPDGLDVITHQNLREVLGSLELQDLTGVAARNEHRLNAVGIYTPLQMLDATPEVLRLAFGGVVGEWWHQRLRGWEVDDIDYDIKSCGRQYVLERNDLGRQEIVQRLHHLVESVGAKLRSQGKAARGVRIYVRCYSAPSWKGHELAPLPFYSDAAIWALARRIFMAAPAKGIKMISITCYHLEDGVSNQLSLFGDELAREQTIAGAIDAINARWGERTVHSADTLGTGIYVKQKIPFGSTRYL
jgi:DNA polymerase-4